MIIMFPDHPNTVGSLLLPRCTAPLLLLWIMLLSWWQFPPRHLWTATIIEVSPCTGQSLFHWSSQLAPDACSTNGILQRFASRKNSKRPVSFPYVSSLRSILHPHYKIFWKPPTTFVSWTARGLCPRSGIWLMKCGIFQWNGCKLISKTPLSNWQSSAVCPFLSWNFKPSFGTITPVILIPAQVRRGQINALSTNRKYTD